MSIDQIWRINALRAMIDPDPSFVSSSRRELFSLRDIIRLNHNDDADQEAYLMLHDHMENAQEADGKSLDKTLLVKRTKLMFNDKECIVLTFQDISTIKKLKHEE